MKKFFSKFKKQDWLTFALTVVLFVLTLFPYFADIPTTHGWLRSALISLGAVVLGVIVLSQIGARESDVEMSGEIDSLKSSVEAAIPTIAVHEVPAEQIRDELDRMLDSTKEWYFRGGSARWQRDAVLPKLALNLDRPVNYHIQIISPFEWDLCVKYADYRKRSRPDDERAEPEQIRIELLAFIFATAVWSSRSKIFPKVTLLHRFSPFRLDGNADSLMITVADLTKNGLQTNAGNWYHTSLVDEFFFEAGHATRLHLPPGRHAANGADDVKGFFAKVRSCNPDATAGWTEPGEDSVWEEIFKISGVARD